MYPVLLLSDGNAIFIDKPESDVQTCNANGVFIALACNSHYDLLAVCKAAEDYYSKLPQGSDRGHDILVELAQFRAAIAKAQPDGGAV